MVGIRCEVEFGREFEGSIEFEDALHGGGNKAQNRWGVGLIWDNDKRQTKQQSC
jgi:hypothetical protein